MKKLMFIYNFLRGFFTMKVVKIALKMHEIAPFLKVSWGACPQTPLAKARSSAARDMPLRGMYIQNPRNFKVGPPPLEISCIRPCVYGSGSKQYVQ